MRTAIITDIHSNIHALERVLEHIDRTGADRIVCLGDVIDGCAFPRECIAMVQDKCAYALCGNHEALHINARYEKDRPGRSHDISERFPHNEVTQCTAQLLRPADREWMRKLPTIIQEHGIMFVHGAPTLYAWGQVGDFLFPQNQTALHRAWRFMASQDACIAFVGHTHRRYVFSTPKTGGAETTHFAMNANVEYAFSQQRRHIVTGSSAGMAFDGDARAGWVLLDNTRVTLYRTRYDIDAASHAAGRLGYPASTFLRFRDRLRNGGRTA